MIFTMYLKLITLLYKLKVIISSLLSIHLLSLLFFFNLKFTLHLQSKIHY